MSFTAKEKEPIISPELQDIIQRSIGDKVDNNINTNEVARFKFKIMNLLTSNQDILSILHHPDHPAGNGPLNGDDFKDTAIFAYMKLPDVKEETRNYICFEVNELVNKSELVRERNKMQVFIRVVSHKEDYRTDWGIPRQDLLGIVVNQIFDKTNILGFQFKKQSDSGYVTNDGYCYRELYYLAAGFANPKGKLDSYVRK